MEIAACIFGMILLGGCGILFAIKALQSPFKEIEE
jgi:hypothetical protein